MNHSNAEKSANCTSRMPGATPSWIKPPFFMFLVLVLTVALSGCGDSSTDPGGGGNGNSNGNGTGNGNGGNNDPGAEEVLIQGLAYNPSSRTIETGTTLTWTNQDNVVHTVTSGADRDHDGLFDSGNLSPGETFAYTFEDPGTYSYFCRPHVGMSGTVIVEDP